MQDHLYDTMIEDYARGHLSPGWSLGVAAHLALSPSGRAHVRALDAVGGALLEDIEPVAVAEDALDSAMARIADTSRASEGKPDVPSPEPGSQACLPEPLRTAFGGDVATLKWRRLNHGVSQVILETDDRTTTCRLLKVKAGYPVSAHSHGGLEFTLVLSGSFSDELGTFARGDVELTDDTVEHQPVAGDEDCVCFAVTDRPLRFRNPLMRLVQPFFRI